MSFSQYKNIRSVQAKKKQRDPNSTRINVMGDKNDLLFQADLPKDKLKIDYVSSELQSLLKEIEEYIEELDQNLKNPVKMKFLGKQEIEDKIQELQDIEDQIRDFADENEIDVEKDVFKNKYNNTLNKIEQKIESLLQQREKVETDGFLLLNPIKQKTMLLKQIDVCMSKLNKIELLLGSDKKFQSQSLLQQYQSLYYDLENMEPQSIIHQEKKLTLTTDEMRRMNLKEQQEILSKQEIEDLYQFLGKVDHIVKKQSKNYEENAIVRAVTLIKDCEYFIEKASKDVINKGESLKNFNELMQKTLQSNMILKQLKTNLEKIQLKF